MHIRRLIYLMKIWFYDDSIAFCHIHEIHIFLQHDPGRFASLRRTVESARLEILALENQIMEQEKCHLEQIALMENERRLNARDREAERVQYESRIGELSNQ